MPRPLWADFGAAQIVPGLSRESAAAQDEAFTAAMRLGALQWCYANLLQPAPPPSARLCSSSGELPMAALLPAYSDGRLQFAGAVGESHMGEIMRGTVDGQPALIKLAYLEEDPHNALELAAEACAWSSRLVIAPAVHS